MWHISTYDKYIFLYRYYVHFLQMYIFVPFIMGFTCNLLAANQRKIRSLTHIHFLRLTSLLHEVDQESASVLAKSRAAGLVIGKAGPSQQSMS